jgi:hypothetical protein
MDAQARKHGCLIHACCLKADQLREATNGNFGLGNTRFIAEIEQALGRRVVRGKAGRPPKPREVLLADAEA